MKQPFLWRLSFVTVGHIRSNFSPKVWSESQQSVDILIIDREMIVSTKTRLTRDEHDTMRSSAYFYSLMSWTNQNLRFPMVNTHWIQNFHVAEWYDKSEDVQLCAAISWKALSFYSLFWNLVVYDIQTNLPTFQPSQLVRWLHNWIRRVIKQSLIETIDTFQRADFDHSPWGYLQFLHQQLGWHHQWNKITSFDDRATT